MNSVLACYEMFDIYAFRKKPIHNYPFYPETASPSESCIETCRGEWNHIANCYFAVVLFIINPFWTAFILTILLFLGNLPFAIIQRYNRFRLVKLKNTLIKKAERAKKLEARKKSKTKEQVSIQDSDGEAVSG